jgi:2-amino-4-hydroxy-6-hydroxymethyldihydropteridine diphosphokinase
LKKTVYLGLGSNQGDRHAYLEAAIARLGELGRVTALSSFYETEPVELIRQEWFLNCALALETELLPRQLLKRILEIEHALGRKRRRPKGPRTLDIDILLFGRALVALPGLKIPHPAGAAGRDRSRGPPSRPGPQRAGAVGRPARRRRPGPPACLSAGFRQHWRASRKLHHKLCKRRLWKNPHKKRLKRYLFPPRLG